VSAAVVRREELDVFVTFAPIDFVLDSVVREVHLAIEVRQIVLARPVTDFVLVPPRSAVAVRSVAVVVLQELLVFALEIVFEHDAVNVGAVVSKALGFVHVGAIELGIVLQFARLLNAIVKRLPIGRVLAQSPRFEQVAAFLRQRHDSCIAVEAGRVHQTGLPQMPQLAVPRIKRAVEGVSEIVGPNDAKRPDAGQRARL
jgi:hypothetical protein